MLCKVCDCKLMSSSLHVLGEYSEKCRACAVKTFSGLIWVCNIDDPAKPGPKKRQRAAGKCEGQSGLCLFAWFAERELFVVDGCQGRTNCDVKCRISIVDVAFLLWIVLLVSRKGLFVWSMADIESYRSKLRLHWVPCVRKGLNKVVVGWELLYRLRA